jgi:amino acid adenylation domain-containing protein
MNDIRALLSDLRGKGASVWVDGGDLRYRAPKGILSATDLSRLREYKLDIISFLNKARETKRGAPDSPPLAALGRPNVLPLSYAQERQWFMNQLGQVDITTASVRLKGVLKPWALERAFASVVERHESLRTCFVVVNDSPVQVIHPTGHFILEVEDLSQFPKNERALAVRNRVQALTQQPFDLERGPLFRAYLFSLSANEHVATVIMHHIVSDAWSLGVLIREVAGLYAAFVEGRQSPFSRLAIQYADYALWQRSWLTGKVLEEQITYWKKRLSGAPAAIDLPVDRTRPATRSHRGGHFAFGLSEEVTSQLKALARREDVTLYMVLLAGFKVALSRWSGQTDIVVGSTIAGRTHRDLEELIGFFVNTLALRTNLSGNPGFRELLHRVKETTLGAYAHQDVPFEKLLEELQPVRDPSRQPLMQVFFSLQNVPQERLQLPGLELHRIGGERSTAKFDLALYMQETAGRLQAWFEYAADLFEPSTIERWAGHTRMLLEAAAAHPEACIGELPMLGQEERDRLLEIWNDTAGEYPVDRCLHELFCEQAAKTPDAIALIHDERELSYGQLDRRSNQLARYLKELGVGPEVIVGLCVERSFDMVVGLLGILKAGGAYLPLDPDYPPDRLAFMMADAQAPVLVTQAVLSGSLPECGKVVRLDADWPAIAVHPASELATEVRPDNVAYVTYTSGSTGRPKGVMTQHRGAVNYLTYVLRTYRIGDETVLQLPTLSFDASVRDLVGPLLAGGRSVLVERHEARDPRALLTKIVDRKVTAILSITPSLLGNVISFARDSARRWPALRLVLCSGEPLQYEHCEGVAQVFGPETLVVNQYGPTECTMTSSYYKIEELDHGRRTVPLGRPIPNAQFYVLDRNGCPGPIGVGNELYIGGQGLSRGYLGRPGLTAERFVPSPFHAGERLYRTGDVVRYLADGNLEFLGRMDHQFKIRGNRVEAGEIEATLTEHPAVTQAVVVAHEVGSGDRQLTAYVVAANPRDASAAELRAHLKKNLPEYMIPSTFVHLESLPLTPHGKVDRNALPAGQRTAEDGAYVAPRTSTEEALASIWAEVLNVERVGIHDNFFDLGGHSLLAMRVIARIRARFETELPLRVIFETPTVAEIEPVLMQRQKDTSEAVRATEQMVAAMSAEQVQQMLQQLRIESGR